MSFKDGLSFIIATRYASEALEILLNSLEYSKNFENELKIICDNPSWQTLKLLQDRKLIHDRDYYIVNFAHLDQTLDWGVAKATKEYLVLTPDDFVFCKDFDKIVMAEMEEAKDRIVTPSYYVGNTSGRMHRDYGWPNWKYVKNRKMDPFRIEEFYNEPLPPYSYSHYYCMNCPMQIMYRDVYEKVNGLTFCSPQGQAHEIEMMKRAEKLGIERFVSRRAMVYHFGGVGNSDNQVTAMEKSKGSFKCSICGDIDSSFGDIEHYGTERGKIVLETGLYLCERCEKDGWKIDVTEAKLRQEIKL
jgi:hypothetical protein